MFTGRPAAATAWMKSVCRQRKAGVCSTSTTAATGRDLVDRVHVRQHRHADLPPHLGENAQALVHARPAKARVRAAVGLVVRRLEDERDAQRGADLREPARDVHLQRLAFDDARPRDHEQRTVEATSKSQSFM